MKVNGWRHRYLTPRRDAGFKVQLGPGQKRYLEGWVNVDANMFTGRCDIWADLRNPLPFRDGGVGFFYSHHMVEHLPDLEFHFREVFRCLHPGGVYRVGGPNGDAAIHKFVAQDHGWFSDFPDSRGSIGGRFENFIFCRREHLTVLTFSYLEELLRGAGFDKIRSCLPVRDTDYPEAFSDCLAIEHETDFEHPHTLIVECRKPG